MTRIAVTDLPMVGLKRIEAQRLGDTRGFLARLFCADELRGAGWTASVAQINHTYTARKGTVRGLHFQHPPHAEMKLVNCIRGEIFDVAADLRRGSPSFLRWHGERLSAENSRALLIPPGFAHGFQALTDDVELIYCHSAPHTPAAEGGLNPRDRKLAITWLLPIADMSSRDAQYPMLDGSFAGVAP